MSFDFAPRGSVMPAAGVFQPSINSFLEGRFPRGSGFRTPGPARFSIFAFGDLSWSPSMRSR